MAFSSDNASIFLVLAAALLGACTHAGARTPVVADSECVLTPPPGFFEATTTPAAPLPAADELPSNPGAWTTLITPREGIDWDPKTGLVKSPDGSLRLRGVVDGPPGSQGYINIAVFIDYATAAHAEITVHGDDRTRQLGHASGFRARAGVDGPAATFDIELPRNTVRSGAYREIQTLVWFDGGSIDARRWTVVAGSNAPAPVACIDADAAIADMPTRTRLAPDGQLVVRAPRSTTLAVVPLRAANAGAVMFLRVDRAGRGWEGALGEGVEMAAMWEAPFSGPGTGWISSFWSVPPAVQ
jgi:hypothetical protein